MQRTPEGPIREEEALGKAYDARLMRRLLGYLRPYKWQTVGAVGMLIVASGLELVGPWLTKVAIDSAIPEGDMNLLVWLAAAYLGSLLLAAGLQYGQTLLTTWIGQGVMKDLRGAIFSHLQELDLRFFDANPVGRLLTRVTSDVESLNEMLTSGVVTIFGDVFTLSFIVVAMLLMDWELALVTFSVLPLVFGAAWLFRYRVREAYRDIRVRLARINAFLQERIGGMTVVQLFRQEGPSRRRFQELNDEYLSSHLRSITYYALFFPVIELLTALALALIIWYGGGRALEGAMTIGVIAAFLQYAQRFFRPIRDLSQKYNVLQSAMASSERIFKLLDEEPRIREPEVPATLPSPVRGRIEFDGVWFRYQEEDGGPREGTGSPRGASGPSHGASGPSHGGRAAPEAVAETEDEWVLRDVSFTAEPGQRVAVVGPTGAGKSTMINLLLRFYDPQRGRILVDGVDIRQLPIKELRSRLGLVLQDVYLFSGTAAENIALDREGVGEEEMRRAARRVGIARRLERLPSGYDSPLGERGGKLSVGERQLVSFARALAGDPDVLLLDEATSSVDSEIEARIQRALEELMVGRTSLIIAHRLSTIEHADRILVVHHGEIRERGTHQELLDRDGLYSRLYRIQFAGAAAVA